MAPSVTAQLNQQKAEKRECDVAPVKKKEKKEVALKKNKKTPACNHKGLRDMLLD